MSPERLEKMRRILRLAVRLSADERDDYLSAVVEGDDELKCAIEAYFSAEQGVEPTLREGMIDQKRRFPFAEVPEGQKQRVKEAFDLVCGLSPDKRDAIVTGKGKDN